MRTLAASLLSALVVLAVAPAARAEPTWSNPVRIMSTQLTPGSTLSCWGIPMVAGQVVGTTNATYAWSRDDIAMADAVTREYFVRNADLGHQLRCQMTLGTAEGPLSGTSEPVVVPVVDDGPPRLVHNGASLNGGAFFTAGMNVPVVIRDVGPVSDALFCSPGVWSGINGPTGSRWTFEFLRNGAVIESLTRDGDPNVAWLGYPA